jgi:hypothetical protein
MINLRNLHPERFDAKGLVSDLYRAHVVRVIWPSGDAQVIKGRELLQRVVDAGKSETFRVLQIEIANTTQAELLAAALVSSPETIDFDRFEQMVVIASTIPASDDDFERFDEQLRKSAH